MERPDPRVRWYWVLATGWASAMVMGMTALVVVPTLMAAEGTWAYAVGGSWLALGAILAAYTLIAPWVRYRTFRFLVAERQLWLRDGVIFRREKVVPSSRLQHVDVTFGPIERIFGLSTLVVFTAGGAVATFRVPGLSPERAELLRSRVLEVAEQRRPASTQSAPIEPDGA